MDFQDDYFSFEIMHVEHDGIVNWLRFKWEPGVREMLKTKSVDGRNSSVFDTRNVHIATAPLGGGLGEFIIVGNDQSFVPAREFALPLTLLDAQHAIHGKETHSSDVNPRGNFRSD